MDYSRLVRECLKEKSQAQRELYEHFAEIMLGVCYRYTRSVRDAEDVLQEGFVKVFHHLKQYKHEGELGVIRAYGEYGIELSQTSSQVPGRNVFYGRVFAPGRGR
jgi:hypothetical protein